MSVQPLRISCMGFDIAISWILTSRVTDIELQGAGDSIESIEVIYDDHRLSIPGQGEHHFHADFNQPLTVRGETLSVSVVHRRKWYIGPKPAPEVIEIGVHDVLSKLPTQKFQTACNRLVITLGLSPSSIPVSAGASRDAIGLRPTTEELLYECPRFRILVIGQSGVGKSALINRVFGIEQAFAASSEPGKADTEEELISQQNDRLVLHDSKGFEPADNVNCDAVKSFITDRKKREHIKDQLHAVWLCFRIPIPGHGERLLEDGVETLLKEDTSVLQNIPTIVVFTKYDKLLTHMRIANEADPEAAAQQYLKKHCYDPIKELDGTPDLSYVAVSSQPRRAQGRSQLIELTSEKVTKTFGSRLGPPSPVSVVTSMAQRTLPHLKVAGSITVGKQRYWRTLASSPNFPGYTIQECLRVIHTDIVSVWNFYDPSGYLDSEPFRELMVNLVGTIDESATRSARLARSTTCDTIGENTVPLTFPIILPFEAGLASAQWAYETYQQVNNVHQRFMAYIVDLIHVLEILFTLTPNDSEKKLTRRAIKLAFNAYHDSEMRRNTHVQVKNFDCKGPGRDVVFEKVVSLVRMSPTDDVDLTRAIGSIPGSELERDEEWHTDDDGRQAR
ncbi:hypothetical protein PISMIDRAFT_13693 [Pisolithus microcarpus 441]|uniref:G domain-containing protein n=1 Tax=Pisolithus microcarpus 441 TaxID=765257 RepID=A0A0C9ZAD2_9AGAM|nr:hypothetical protein PISMIDRAFT_13693 [Pisolithus microcarpus 441]